MTEETAAQGPSKTTTQEQTHATIESATGKTTGAADQTQDETNGHAAAHGSSAEPLATEDGAIDMETPDDPSEETLPETQPRGTPPVDIKCGPLLRYLGMRDTSPDAWRGTAMIVTNDETSDYSEVPFLSLVLGGTSTKVSAEKVLQEQGVTFWRFPLDLKMISDEQAVVYSVNGDEERQFTFYVPALEQTMNTVFQSCNGFSYGVDTKEFKSQLWKNVLEHHDDVHYHVMLGGGDQIYCDAINNDSKIFKKWTHERNPVKKSKQKFDKDAEKDFCTFFLWHYMAWFGAGFWRGANGTTLQPDLPRAMAQIPMINIYDDHDIIDGFGSYTDHTMRAPVFQGVGNVAFKYYMLFQHQTAPDEPVGDEKSWVMGKTQGPYIKQKARSVYARLGKGIGFYGLDCRTERKKMEICRKESYQQMFDRLRKEVKDSNGEIQHLLVMLGVPIAYPRLVWLEWLLTSRAMVPIKALARRGILFSGLLNNFDGAIEILDDLDDHWCAKHHKTERNWLMKQLLSLSKELNTRITILSGDVHLCGIGRFYSKESNDSVRDPNLIFNVISSAVVNTPPPEKVADFLNKRNKVHHLTKEVDEDMVRVFGCDVDGTKRNNTRLLPRRNWCSIIEQGPQAQGTDRSAGPAWDVSDSHLPDQDHEPKYADAATSLSVKLHVEKDQHDAASVTQPYELLIPKLEM